MFPLFPTRTPAVRSLRAEDASAVSALHGASFLHGWSTQEIEAMLRERAVTAHGAGNGRRLDGFVLSRRAADEAEILSIAVDQRARGKGLGSRLLEAHLGALSAQGARTVFLEVEEGNAPALALYARHGFSQVGRRPSYYRKPDGSRTGALILSRRLA